jgi:hypothetical protein
MNSNCGGFGWSSSEKFLLYKSSGGINFLSCRVAASIVGTLAVGPNRFGYQYPPIVVDQDKSKI